MPDSLPPLPTSNEPTKQIYAEVRHSHSVEGSVSLQLNDTENIILYEIGVSESGSSPYTIHKKTGISYPTIFLNSKRLEERGFLFSTMGKNAKKKQKRTYFLTFNGVCVFFTLWYPRHAYNDNSLKMLTKYADVDPLFQIWFNIIHLLSEFDSSRDVIRHEILYLLNRVCVEYSSGRMVKDINAKNFNGFNDDCPNIYYAMLAPHRGAGFGPHSITEFEKIIREEYKKYPYIWNIINLISEYKLEVMEFKILRNSLFASPEYMKNWLTSITQLIESSR